MKIACLGWGSLIWKPVDLPVASEWFEDGPALPVEFCRAGDGGELATALCINAEPVPVLWAWLSSTRLDEACAALKAREAIPAERNDGVGCLMIDRDATGLLSEWAQARDIDALIWTNLPPRIDNVEGQVPTADDAVRYLESLRGEAFDHARAYIESVPAQIDTPYRRAIEQALGWT